MNNFLLTKIFNKNGKFIKLYILLKNILEFDILTLLQPILNASDRKNCDDSERVFWEN